MRDVGSDLYDFSSRITSDDSLLSLRSPETSNGVLPIGRVESDSENSSLGRAKKERKGRGKVISPRARAKKDRPASDGVKASRTYEDAVGREE